jgi:hypothetical protein
MLAKRTPTFNARSYLNLLLYKLDNINAKFYFDLQERDEDRNKIEIPKLHDTRKLKNVNKI